MTDLSSAFGGDLAKALKQYEDVAALRDAARADVEAAQRLLKDAKAADDSADVRSILEGGEGADQRAEPEAKRALAEAERHAAMCERARLVALDKVSDAAREPAHAEKLAKGEEGLTKSALSALATLEKLIGEIAEKRALRRWLQKPVLGDDTLDEVRARDLPIGAERLRAPNGEPARAADLFGPVREALMGTEKPENLTDSYGVPSGFRLVDPFGGGVIPTLQDKRAGALESTASQRLFAEQAEGRDEEEAVG